MRVLSSDKIEGSGYVERFRRGSGIRIGRATTLPTFKPGEMERLYDKNSGILQLPISAEELEDLRSQLTARENADGLVLYLVVKYNSVITDKYSIKLKGLRDIKSLERTSLEWLIENYDAKCQVTAMLSQKTDLESKELEEISI